MKKHLALFLVILAASPVAIKEAAAQTTSAAPAQTGAAPTADTLAAANELAALMSGPQISNVISPMLDQVWPPIESSLRARIPNLDEATTTDLRAKIDAVMVEFVTNIWKQAPAMYAQSFSAEEMRGIIAFYKTPVGEKALKTMPQIAAKTMALLQPAIPAFQRELGTTIQTVLQAHGFKSSP